MQTISFARTILVAATLFGSGCHWGGSDLSEASSGVVPQDSTSPAVTDGPGDSVRSTDGEAEDNPGRALFDGRTLAGWEATNFGGEGEVEVADGSIQLAMGYPMTGVTSVHESLPTDNYELSL